jgi:multidrug resistance efflux pump
MNHEEIKNTTHYLNYKYNRKTNVLYVVMLLVLVAVGISLPYIYVEISSQSRGVIRSKYENVTIHSVVQGKVTSCRLENNKEVKKGDTLLIVSPEILEVQQENKTNLLTDLNNQYDDLQQLTYSSFISPSALKTSLYQTEFFHHSNKIQELTTKLQQATFELQRTKKGLQQGVSSQSEYDKTSYEIQNLKTQIQTLNQQQRSSWQNNKRQVLEQIKTQQGNINQLKEEKKNYYITAPVSGTIFNYKGVLENSFINPNETIAELTPENELLVECIVEPKDIGWIKKNQKVKLQFDAFNYNQWGLGEAQVLDIDKNITIQEKQIFFKVRCKMITKNLKLKNSYQVPIKKGMTLTARFFITERSLWDLLYDKIDDWFNPKLISS